MNQENIGTFILECRKQKNLTQEQLANILVVSNRTISKWENGNCMPDYSILPLLCETLNITINELLSGEKLTEKNYQKKLEENLILNMAEVKRKMKKTLSWIIIIIISIIFLIFLTEVLELISERYNYHKSYLSKEELNVTLCLGNDSINITIETKDQKPMLMDIKLDPKTMDYTYNPYHIRKESYIENYPSKYTYDFKDYDNAHAIIIANEVVYKKGQTLKQCRN